MKPVPKPACQTRRSQLIRLGPVLVTLLAGLTGLHAQTGPFSPTNWPPTINPNAMADYFVVDPNAVFSTPAGWSPTLSFAGGGDQTYQTVTLGGLTGDQSTSTYLNIADSNFAVWANTPVLDILLQVYGNDKLYNADGSGRGVSFLTGTLPNPYAAGAGPVPPGANNSQWNWMLFTITNGLNSVTGQRYVGFVPSPAPAGSQDGGVNSGTLRIQNLSGIIVRAVAVGEHGAFGTPNQINVFPPPPACDPEPAVNLAFVDVNAKLTNNLIVLNNGDQTVTYQSNVGPAADQRTAVQATATYMNFGILNGYLGAPCNPPRPMKVCVEFYDDPALAGASFGPEAYAADSTGDLATYAGPLYTLQGSGQWVKVAFWVPNVDLAGVNTAPLTGGPRLIFNGGFPFIDRVELGVQRTGTNALAGLDPDATYYLDPTICTTNYGNYAEIDLQQGITNNLNVGTSGGDQNMVVEMAGPSGDQRLSVRPDAGNNNIQFAILNQVFGPNYQDNARVAQVLTYYDDPALAGAVLYPQVYQSWVGGISTLKFPNANTVGVTLQGSGQWRDAYFELPDANFTGVNQGPQSLVRYETMPAKSGDPTTGYIHVTRVRYAVIRPCGPYAGVNLLQSSKPIAEYGDTVSGFQDSFTGATRNTNWVAIGPGGDNYVQQAGLLRVFASHGDPNHLIYQAPGASNTVEEVLARIRILSAQGGTSFHPGIGVGIDPASGQGMNLAFRDYATEAPARHFKFNDDDRGLGPTNGEMPWTNGVWYWLRLRQEPKMDGTNTVFGKVWPADWSTPEPATWQLLWADAAVPTPYRSGYAGVSASSFDAMSQFEVSYILIKAAGLPAIQVQAAATPPAPQPPFYIGGGITLAGTNVNVSWFGLGTLQSAPVITGPWTDVLNATNSYTAPATSQAQFFRVRYP